MSGIAEMIGGVSTMVSAGYEQQADLQASQRQYAREWDAASAGIRQTYEDSAFQQSQVRQAGSELAASQAAAYSDSGVDAGVGTAANTQANTQMQAAMDAQTSKNNAARAVWGFKKQQTQAYEDQRARDDASLRKSVGTMLGGAGQFASGLTKVGT